MARLAPPTVVVLSLALSACGGGGGGGVGSTPAPPPAPTPTPSPTPSPPPTGANASLLAPLKSETFKTIGSVGTISVPTNGSNVTTTAAPATPSFTYNETNQTYTIAQGGNTQSFASGDVDPTQTDATITTYKKTAGTTTEFLTLVKNGTGAGQTRYVGSAFWQRQTNGTTATTGSFNALTYGVETPAAAVPRSGTAGFDVRLVGVRTFSTLIYAVGGIGRFDVDFLSGGMVGRGSYSEREMASGTGPSNLAWNANALLSAVANSFAGSIYMDSIGTGELRGAFYGPNAEEIGAAYSISSGTEQGAVGTIYGVRGTNQVNQGTSLSTPSTAMFYKPQADAIRAAVDAAGNLGTIQQGSKLASVYQEQNGMPFVFFNADGRITKPFPSGFTNPPLYQIYGSNLAFVRGGGQYDLRNGQALFDAFVFGFDTASANVPRTGTASFNVALNGALADPGAKLQTLTGTGSLSANFQTGALTTLGSYLVNNGLPASSSGGTQTGSGTWNGTATLSSNANAYSGTITLTGANSYTGALAGKFFGPGAEETGATFNAVSTAGGMMAGALYGARGADTTASQQGLAALTTTTDLPGNGSIYAYVPSQSPPDTWMFDPEVTITYDPVAKSYRFRSVSTGINLNGLVIDQTLTAADRDAARSDNVFDVYRAGTTDARIFKPGAGNSAIALTYTSFAEITKPADYGGRPATAAWFIPFGGLTPQFQIPTSGSATYSGVLYGRGGGGTFPAGTALSGTSTFNVDFGTSNASMLMAVMAQDGINPTVNLGSFTYGGSVSGACPGCGVTNRYYLTLNSAEASGILHGFFFGPSAAEFGASFDLRMNSGAYNGAVFTGATVGKKN